MLTQLRQMRQAGSQTLAANSAALIATTLAGSGFGFLFWLLAARVYTPAQVGLGAAAISALTLLTTIGEMGLGTALIRFLPGAGAQQVRLLNVTLLAVAGSTLVVAAVFALGVAGSSPDLRELVKPGDLLLFLAAAVAFNLALLLDRAFIALQAAHFMLGRTILMHLLRLAVLLLAGRWFGAAGLVLAVGVSAAVTFVGAALITTPRVLPGYRLRPAWDSALLRDKLGYTLGNHCASLLWSAPPLIYPLLVVALLGPTANAPFYISWMIANLLFIVPVAVSTAAFARAANTGQAGAFRAALGGTLALLVPLALGVAVAAPWLLAVFGGAYRLAGPGLLSVLALSAVPYTINTFLIVYHRTRQHVGTVVWVSGSISALCLVLGTAGGVLGGLPGVGLGWLAGQTVGAAGVLLYQAWLRRGQLRIAD